jgi:N-acyl-D-aspartate/D-glutamate deacylase
MDASVRTPPIIAHNLSKVNKSIAGTIWLHLRSGKVRKGLASLPMDNHHGRNLKVEERAWESLDAVSGECAVRVTFSTIAMGEIALVGRDRVLVRANLESRKQGKVNLDESMGSRLNLRCLRPYA